MSKQWLIKIWGSVNETDFESDFFQIQICWDQSSPHLNGYTHDPDKDKELWRTEMCDNLFFGHLKR